MAMDLFGSKRFEGFYVDPTKITIIGLDTKDGQEHRLWDKRITMPLDEAMVKNIMAVGVQEPIVLDIDGKGDDKRALVIDGRGRVMHAREANRRLAKIGDPEIRVPAILKKDMEDKEIERLMISLNAMRRDDSPLMKIDKAARMAARGHEAAEIALAFGQSPDTIKEWLAIHGLSADVRKAIESGKITPTAAFKLSSMPKEKQSDALAELIAEGGKLTVTRVATHVRKAKKGNGASDTAPTKRLLTKIIDYVEKGENDVDIPEDFIKALRFAKGDLSPTAIKGLSAVIEAVTPKPREKKAKKKKAD